MMRAVRLWVAGVAGLACMAASGEPVPQDVRDKVEAAFHARFLRPETNIWRFDAMRPYLGSDKVVCGFVNFQSAAQRYVGFHQFYAIIHQGEVQLSQFEDVREDSSGALLIKLKTLCD